MRKLTSRPVEETYRPGHVPGTLPVMSLKVLRQRLASTGRLSDGDRLFRAYAVTGLAGLGLLLLGCCAGCRAEPPTREPAHRTAHLLAGPAAEAPTAAAGRFDPERTGTLVGHVTWEGALPRPPAFLHAVARSDGLGLTYMSVDNPNRPRIDSTTRGVGEVIVYFRGVNPADARPWDHPPVQVEIGSGRIEVLQGDYRGRCGFLRLGDSFFARSTEPSFHILRGRGDDFFSLTLPDLGSTVTRALRQAGRVELSSGTGLYWARADIFVSEHPYLARTDPEGRYRIEAVPEGTYEVVVWHPGWEPLRHERDPDSTAITRMTYSPPLVRSETIEIFKGGVTSQDFRLP